MITLSPIHKNVRKTLDDRSVKLTIPPGTNPGQRFSIPQYGIPDINTLKLGTRTNIINTS